MPTDAPDPHATEFPEGSAGVDTVGGSSVGRGTVLAERYRLLERIGRGGMGSVWEAEHLTLGTVVAIKLIAPHLADGERARARFLREARAAAGLKSPYVVQVFDYGVHEQTPYIAMERLEGESLAERLARDGSLPHTDVVRVIDQVARAVAKAHAAGVVHRDLKPDNVFLTTDEDGLRCKVLDFGIAKVLTDADTLQPDTHSGTLVGTAFYMSPEQATNARDIDARADLWALGVIAYECVVGRRPFDGPTLPVVAVKILADPLPVPSEHADVPPGFDAWFARATRRDRDERFASARVMATELAAALGVHAPSLSASVSATVPSVVSSAPAAPRRGLGWPWVVGIAGAGLGGWFVWQAFVGGPPRELPRKATPPPAVGAGSASERSEALASTSASLASSSSQAADARGDVGSSTGDGASTETTATNGESGPALAPKRAVPRDREPTPTTPKPDVDDLEF